MPLRTRQNEPILRDAYLVSVSIVILEIHFLIMDVFYFNGALRDNHNYSDFFLCLYKSPIFLRLNTFLIAAHRVVLMDFGMGSFVLNFI